MGQTTSSLTSSTSSTTSSSSRLEVNEGNKKALLEMHTAHSKIICIVGAGLGGCMAALLFAKLGFTVHIYERRELDTEKSDDTGGEADIFGTSKSAQKRSINLALSYRGILALKEAGLGLYEKVMQSAIRMPCRIIHNRNGGVTKMMYGTTYEETLYSVSRLDLNRILTEAVQQHPSITLFSETTLIECDIDGHCVFKRNSNLHQNHRQEQETHNKKNKTNSSENNKSNIDFDKSKNISSTVRDNDNILIENRYDLIIGADGAYSAVRDHLLKSGRINFSRDYIRHGYKELSIPVRKVEGSKDGNTEAVLELEGLHIWPRESFMLIALPNADKSFTCTLFAPYSGDDGFDAIDVNNNIAVENYFKKHFPDVFPLLKDTVFDDYKHNPVGSLVSIRMNPWNNGRILLIGDAAHAVVPFFGQGMNAAFEDAFILYSILSKQLVKQRQNNFQQLQRVHEQEQQVRSQTPSPSNQSEQSIRSLDKDLKDICDVHDYILPSPSSLSTNFHFEEGMDVDLVSCIEEFSRYRVPAGMALSDLCLEHYHDMASNTASSSYLLRKKIEGIISTTFPNSFKSLYTMVSFTNKPYHEAVAIARKQDQLFDRILSVFAVVSVGGLAFASYRIFRSG